MHTTLTNNRGKFRTEILSHLGEIAVFVRVRFLSHTLYIGALPLVSGSRFVMCCS